MSLPLSRNGTPTASVADLVLSEAAAKLRSAPRDPLGLIAFLV
jgi:hypothetical protein